MDHWVTRLRSEARKCEFHKMNDDEAIKLVPNLAHSLGETAKRNYQ